MKDSWYYWIYQVLYIISLKKLYSLPSNNLYLDPVILLEIKLIL